MCPQLRSNATQRAQIMTRSLHRQQLFHWIGRDIEQEVPGQSRDKREKRAGRYVGHLKNSLRDGIWVKVPQDQEEFQRESWRKLMDMPIACFTEWGLADSRAHVAHYGRLGFGFARSWVYKRGGQPVTYMSPAVDSRFNRALQAVDEAARKLNQQERLCLDYILHFTKPVRSHRAAPKTAGLTPQRKRVPQGSVRDPFLRSFGSPMPYVSEREWRVVLPIGTKDKKGHWKTAHQGAKAQFYLPYKPGTDLFTLVLPDNLTMQMVLSDHDVMSHIMPKNAPHVTLLSLDDVDTF
jgi:hypothetical protein